MFYTKLLKWPCMISNSRCMRDKLLKLCSETQQVIGIKFKVMVDEYVMQVMLKLKKMFDCWCILLIQKSCLADSESLGFTVCIPFMCATSASSDLFLSEPITGNSPADHESVCQTLHIMISGFSLHVFNMLAT